MKRILLVLALLAAPAAHGSIILAIDIDTSAIVGSTVNLDLVLIGLVGNTVTANNFLFGGGMPGLPPIPPAGIVLDDSSQFFVEFIQPFTAGSRLHFDVTASNIGPSPGNFPDNFSVYLLDRNLNPLPTTDPTGADGLFSVDLKGAPPTPQVWQLTVSPSFPTPEPGSAILLALGLGLLTKIALRPSCLTGFPKHRSGQSQQERFTLTWIASCLPTIRLNTTIAGGALHVRVDPSRMARPTHLIGCLEPGT
jgi:hypothetical protein